MCANRFNRAIRNRRRANHSWRRSAAVLGTNASANAATEYAILLAMVVGVALVASRFLGDATEDVFARAFSASDSGSSVAAASGPEGGGMAGSSETAGADDRPGFLDLQLLATEFVAIAALGSLLYVVHKVRKRREFLGDDEEVPDAVCSTVVQNRLFKKRQQIYQLLSKEMDTVLANRMDVSHIMSHCVTTVLPSASAEKVRELMKSKKLRHMMVCDAKGDLIGILSDRDLAKGEGSTAADMMTPDPITVSPETPISPAVTMMIDRHISCLPVVDGEGKLCAVLTSTDLMMALQCAMQILHKLAGQVGGPETSGTRPTDAFGQPGVAVDSASGAAPPESVAVTR